MSNVTDLGNLTRNLCVELRECNWLRNGEDITRNVLSKNGLKKPTYLHSPKTKLRGACSETTPLVKMLRLQQDLSFFSVKTLI